MKEHLGWLSVVMLVGLVLLYAAVVVRRTLRDPGVVADSWTTVPEAHYALDAHVMEPRVRLFRRLPDGTEAEAYAARSHAHIFVTRGACVGPCPCDDRHPVSMEDAMFCPAPFEMICDGATATTRCVSEGARPLFDPATTRPGKCSPSMGPSAAH